MVRGRLGTQHHPTEGRGELNDRRARPVAAHRRDRTTAVVWAVCGASVVVVLAVALVVVVRDPSIELFARWTLALFFLGGPLVWSARRHRDALRRRFGR